MHVIFRARRVVKVDDKLDVFHICLWLALCAKGNNRTHNHMVKGERGKWHSININALSCCWKQYQDNLESKTNSHVNSNNKQCANLSRFSTFSVKQKWVTDMSNWFSTEPMHTPEASVQPKTTPTCLVGDKLYITLGTNVLESSSGHLPSSGGSTGKNLEPQGSVAGVAPTWTRVRSLRPESREHASGLALCYFHTIAKTGSASPVCREHACGCTTRSSFPHLHTDTAPMPTPPCR